MNEKKQDFWKDALVLFFIAITFIFLTYNFWGYELWFYQGNFCFSMSYDFPAYEAYEKVVVSFPMSPKAGPSRHMMSILLARNPMLASFIATRASGTTARPSSAVKSVGS